MSQPASSPAASFQSPGKILDWLPPVFFVLGLSMGVVATVIDTANEALIGCIVLFFTLALILGLWRWPVLVKWIVGILMLGLYDYGHFLASDTARLNASMDHNHGEIAFAYKGFFLQSLVLLSAVGLIASGVMDGLPSRAPSPGHLLLLPAPLRTENRRVFAWGALAFFIVGSLGWPLLIALHANENAAGAIGVVASALALIFGLISWRGRPGYKISMAVPGVVALLGILVVPLGLYGVFIFHSSNARTLSYGLSRDRTNFSSSTNFAPGIHTMATAQPDKLQLHQHDRNQRHRGLCGICRQ